MARILKNDELLLIKELVTNVCKLNEGDEKFKEMENLCVKNLSTAHSFYANPKDIEKSINGLCDKFLLHSLIAQSNHLRQLADTYLKHDCSEYELQNRLNVFEFLICMSESPTIKAIDFEPESTRPKEEDNINWKDYLMEGFEKWKRPESDDSSSWSDDDDDGVELINVHEPINDFDQHAEVCNEEELNHANEDALNIKKRLLSTNWSNQDNIRIISNNSCADLRIGLLWEEHQRSSIEGSMMKKLNILPENIIAREIIWQFFVPHNSTTYLYENGKFIPKLDIATTSATNLAINNFLYNFVPYLEYFHKFRKFSNFCNNYESIGSSPCETYRSYITGQSNLISLLHNELLNMENNIRNDDSFTLTCLNRDIKLKLKMATIMMDIHNKVVISQEENSPLNCATNLLCNLHKCLSLSTSKLEQDVCLTLYLESLYKYINIIDAWLNEDVLHDAMEEFIISEENFNENMNISKNTLFTKSYSINECIEEDWQMNLHQRPLTKLAKDDKFLQFIYNDIFVLSKNIHLLRLLNKLDADKICIGTLYNELIERVLRKISVHFQNEEVFNEITAIIPEEECAQEINGTNQFSVIDMDNCQYFTEQDQLSNMVDTSDGFLMSLFEDIFNKIKNVPTKKAKPMTLYEKINKLTKTLFPCKDIVKTALKEIVIDRFETSGDYIKNILIQDYQLEKYIQIIQYLFLFKNDIIFPFYRRLFEEMNESKENVKWGNEISLNAQLQDILFDHFGNLSDKCNVTVKNNWQLCNDPLKACSMITAHYIVQWPINIFIRNEHIEKYQEIFQFVLKIKWALYTLNQMNFKNILVKKVTHLRNQSYKGLKTTFLKLNFFNFILLNDFNKIQHFIFGYIFEMYVTKFDEDIKLANDFDSMKLAHDNFINGIYTHCSKLRDTNSSSYGINMMLYLVRKLRLMWKNVGEVTEVKIKMFQDVYTECHKCINSLVYDCYNY